MKSSALWPILASMEPVLGADVVVSRQAFRGQPWFVVTDTASGESWRLAPAMAVVLCPERFSGTLAERLAQSDPQADTACREQVAAATLRLYQAAALDFREAPPPEIERLRQGPAPRRSLNPLALRLPLLDPDKLLDRCAPAARILFSRATLFAVCALLTGVLPLALMHAPSLANDLLSQLATTANWINFAACYIALKCAHEFAHALAVKRWGGRVHDMGIMLLVFFPVPYVDASSSTRFPDKSQRIVVAAAGILVEIVAACLALLLWLTTEPGLVHTLAFNVVIIGGISTVIFNGNPLMRFDAYYVLSDWLEIPNLYTRSRRALGARAMRWLFGGDAGAPERDMGETRWLLAYGALSVVYRTGVLLAIAIYLASKVLFVGVVLATWVILSELALPLARFVAALWARDRAEGRRVGRCAQAAVALACVLTFAAVVPLPHATVAAGVVAVSEDAQVRAGADGFIARIEAREGAQVAPGDAVLQLANAALERDLAAARARVLEQESRLRAAAAVDRVAARAIEESLLASRRQEAEIASRIEGLTVLSPARGRYVTETLDPLVGTWVERGENLGYVTAPDQLVVKVTIPESRMDLFRQPAQTVTLQFAAAPGEVIEGYATAEVPASLTRLPSAALGTSHGGPISVDPADPDGLTPLVKVFQIAVKPLGSAAAMRVSGLALARFEHPPEPLLPRAIRAARRLFLAKFPT